jgi:hypothetical protein
MRMVFACAAEHVRPTTAQAKTAFFHEVITVS